MTVIDLPVRCIFTARQHSVLCMQSTRLFRLAVCLSVIRWYNVWYYIKMTQATIIMRSSLEDSPMTLVS